jgi:adenylate kinase
LYFKPPKKDEICDLDGTGLVIREDDSAEIIQERLGAYERQTQPLIDYFRQKGRRLLEIDASNSPPQALVQKICGIIQENGARLIDG